MSHSELGPEDETRFQRGHVVWVEWLDHVESRPFLILGAESTARTEVEYVGVPLSTDAQEKAVRIEADDWESGGLDGPSYALSWRLQSIPHEAIERGLGALSDDIVEDISRSAEAVFDASG